jgi:two-component system LytT family response regulator
VLSSYTLKQYHELLTDNDFFRAHRSYLINLAHVKMYRKGNGGAILMQDGSEIELSKNHKDAFLQIFKA